jgi:hypothetical protein
MSSKSLTLSTETRWDDEPEPEPAIIAMAMPMPEQAASNVPQDRPEGNSYLMKINPGNVMQRMCCVL